MCSSLTNIVPAQGETLSTGNIDPKRLTKQYSHIISTHKLI